MKKLSELQVFPHFSKHLPTDSLTDNRPRPVSNACFSFVNPIKPTSPKYIHHSEELANELGLTISKEEVKAYLSGQLSLKSEDFKPFAMCYGGHQFGQWAGQLGDGRAIIIAEAELNNQLFQFQLKGAGPTPYSRRADGFAVLRSSIREYLCSEAMHHLGIPTTRALSLVTTGDLVTRDIMYDGNPKDEQGAIVCRVAESFIRFGNFEIFAAKRENEVLKQLVDYTIKHHFPALGKPSKDTYLVFFREVVQRTKDLMIQWQRVGFVHGVMNTDNMSIHGLTIDYGPYGWLEDYDHNWTPNTTDRDTKRYRFGNQPNIGLWNLVQLANAIYPLIEDAKPLEEILDEYKTTFHRDYKKMMLNKLGLYDQSIPKSFIAYTEEFLNKLQLDYTIFFRLLSEHELDKKYFSAILTQSSYFNQETLDALSNYSTEWFQTYKNHLDQESVLWQERSEKMKKVNPKYVLRNYMAQLAIENAEKGDFDLIDELYELLKAPYADQPEHEKWFAKRPDWATNKIGSSMLSCSS
ncbi:protein adenylyltransferase SelO [Parvicella tangerina]|uniref:Protein nucleotidyltransferase YdiU n=1 Tax=Parvicella tangerina TaxID=2829795 RepID=A0A916JLR1_9FLAO|nr:YdiU family protein [Parvicella tangerina]CAG5080744.1 Protein adenylyltransferase SelO [Parvicella tangerina]